MGKFVAEQTVKEMIAADLPVKDANVIVLGVTFKENCADLRNSKVIDVVRELKSFGARVYIHDPLADARECEYEYGETLTAWEDLPRANAIVAAVAHREYQTIGTAAILEKLSVGGVFTDVKASYDPAVLRAAGVHVWRM